jgi:hypothetical protein
VSVFARIRGWPAGRRRSGAPPGFVPAEKLASHARRQAQGAAAAMSEQERELLAERERLVERFTLMQADLGGVFYEMAIRDHVRMDVLTRKAAELQRVDAALAEVERALRGGEGPLTATCATCGARQSAEARFCSQCGHALAQAGPTSNGSAGTAA